MVACPVERVICGTLAGSVRSAAVLVCEFFRPPARARWIFNTITATIAIAHMLVVLEAPALKPVSAFGPSLFAPFGFFLVCCVAPPALALLHTVDQFAKIVVPRAHLVNLALDGLLSLVGLRDPSAMVGRPVKRFVCVAFPSSVRGAAAFVGKSLDPLPRARRVFNMLTATIA
jgi:hypothetical protein